MRSFIEYMFAAETQRTRTWDKMPSCPTNFHRHWAKSANSSMTPQRFLRVLCASAAPMMCLYLLLFSSFFAHLPVQAQTDVNTSRVVNEEVTEMPNVMVFLNSNVSDRHPT